MNILLVYNRERGVSLKILHVNTVNCLSLLSIPSPLNSLCGCCEHARACENCWLKAHRRGLSCFFFFKFNMSVFDVVGMLLGVLLECCLPYNVFLKHISI